MARDMTYKHLWKIIDDVSGFEILSNKACVTYDGLVVEAGAEDPVKPGYLVDPPNRFDRPIPFTSQLGIEYVDNVPPA